MDLLLLVFILICGVVASVCIVCGPCSLIALMVRFSCAYCVPALTVSY